MGVRVSGVGFEQRYLPTRTDDVLRMAELLNTGTSGLLVRLCSDALGDTFLTELVDGSGGKLGAEIYEVLGSETANDVIRRVVARLEAKSDAIMRQIQARIGADGGGGTARRHGGEAQKGPPEGIA